MKLISIATFTLLSSSLALACGSPSEGGGTGESSSSGSSSSDGSMTVGSATLPTTTMTSMTASTTDATATDATTDATTTDATTGVDSSGDATAGSTDTGSGSSGGSSSGGTTGGEPVAYGPCDFSMGDPVCADGEQCAVLPDGQHWCGLPCDQDPDPCAEVPSGDAVVECSGFYMQCALNCADNPTCPDGMECVFIMDGLSRCGWPAPA